MTFTFNLLQAMVMTYTYAKGQGQRPVGSKDREYTNGRTDGDDCITWLTNAVGNNVGIPEELYTVTADVVSAYPSISTHMQ